MTWLSHICNAFVDQTIYPVADANKTGIHTFDVGGYECMQVTRSDAKGWILYVHGNSVTLDMLHASQIPTGITRKTKCNFVAPAFPVKKEHGAAYDAKVAQCISTVYNTLVRDGNAPVYLVGRSLGVALALQACKTIDTIPPGIMCISGFDSAKARVPRSLSMLSCLVGDRLDNVRAVEQDFMQNVKLQIIHGSNDQLIPVACAHTLQTAAGCKSTLSIISDMDHTPTEQQWELIFGHMNQFVTTLSAEHISLPTYSRWLPDK